MQELLNISENYTPRRKLLKIMYSHAANKSAIQSVVINGEKDIVIDSHQKADIRIDEVNLNMRIVFKYGTFYFKGDHS